MHASQVSSAGASAYQPVHGQRKIRGTDDDAPAQAVERRSEHHRHHRSERAERSEDNRPARNPLVNAMMEALKGLTQGAGKATDSANADAPAKEVSSPEAKSGDAPKSVKEAALDFANELYGALRAAGESTGAAAPKKTGYGDSSGGYGDLAQGLKRLAQSLSTPAKADGAAPAAATPTPVSAAAPKPVSAPVSAPVSSPVSVPTAAPAPAPAPAPAVSQPVAAAPTPKPAVANPETPKPSAPAPAVAPAAGSASRSPITINITFNFVNSTAIGASRASTTSPADAGKSADSTEAPADSPLLKAFKDLMAALNGDSAEGGAAIDDDKAIQMLQGFLQKIAESLGGDASAQVPEAALPAKGSLISVTA